MGCCLLQKQSVGLDSNELQLLSSDTLSVLRKGRENQGHCVSINIVP